MGKFNGALKHYAEAYATFLDEKDSKDALKRMVLLSRDFGATVPESAERHYRTGILRAKQKRFSEAIEAFQTAIAEAPWFAEAYYNIGIVYDFNHDYRAALNALQTHIQLNPESAKKSAIKNKLIELEDRLGRVDEKAQ